MNEVEDAILDDIESLIDSGATIPKVGANFTSSLKRTVDVGGVNVTYTVIEQANGTISVGTYYWV